MIISNAIIKRMEAKKIHNHIEETYIEATAEHKIEEEKQLLNKSLNS